MLLSLTTANLGTIDIVVLVVLGLGFLVGISTGFAKSFKGISGVLGLAVAIVGVIFAYSYIEKASFYPSYLSALQSGIGSIAETLTLPVRITDGAMEVFVGGAWSPLGAGMEGVKGTIVNMSKGVLVTLLGEYITGEQTLAYAFAMKFGGYIGKSVFFIVLWIFGKIVFNLIGQCFVNLTHANKGMARFDRFVGLVLNVAIIGGILVGVIYYVQTNPTGKGVAQISSAIDGSVLLSWLKTLIGARLG